MNTDEMRVIRMDAIKRTVKSEWKILIIIFIICVTCILFFNMKSGMFIDELYCYSIANSYHAPFGTDIKGGNLVGEVITREEFLDFLTITEGEKKFDFASVYYNMHGDNHPPLYYLIMNVLSSIFAGTFTKWTGLIFNLAIFIASLALLYKLNMKLFENRNIACIGVVLYGLSRTGMSTVLMIRMYMLLTMFSILLAYFIICQVRDFKRWRCLAIALTLLAGLMTQYYFVFYAFFVCAVYVFYALFQKRYKHLLWFIPSALAGALSLLLVFPTCLEHLSADSISSGGATISNLLNVSQYPERLKVFVLFAVKGLFLAVIIGLLAAVIILDNLKRVRDSAISHMAALESLIIIVPAFVSLLLVAIVAPALGERYIYNLAPFFVITVCLLIYYLSISFGEPKQLSLSHKFTFCSILLLAIMVIWHQKPNYLYLEHAQYNAMLKNYSDEKCVCFSDNFGAPIVQDIIQLMNFKEIYVTDTENYPEMVNYLEDNDCFVAYIDTDPYWSSGYDADEILQELKEETGYCNSDLLYQFGLTKTYLISK